MAVPTCSSSCNAALPGVSFSDCNPNIVFSEIRKIYVAKATAASFENWGEAAEWITRISAASTTGDDYIRELTVIGDKPLAAGVVKEISNGRKKKIGSDHTLNYTIDDMSQENYDFMRALECGGKFKVWYETEGGYMYGGNDGILADIDSGVVNNRGREEIETINGVVSWRTKFSPERILSPIFNSGGGSGTFDTAQTFVSATEAESAGITSTATATNAVLKFEFNAITSPTGTPFTMNIKLTVGGTAKLVVTGPASYVGQPFKFTDTTGLVYYGNMANGDVIPTP